MIFYGIMCVYIFIYRSLMNEYIHKYIQIQIYIYNWNRDACV